MLNRRDRVRTGGRTGYMTVAIGRDVCSETVEALADWARRHGAESSLEYYIGTLETARDDRAYARGDFRARGDLDVYENQRERRTRVARSQFQTGWRLADPSDQATREARAIARRHLKRKLVENSERPERQPSNCTLDPTEEAARAAAARDEE